MNRSSTIWDSLAQDFDRVIGRNGDRQSRVPVAVAVGQSHVSQASVRLPVDAPHVLERPLSRSDLKSLEYGLAAPATNLGRGTFRTGGDQRTERYFVVSQHHAPVRNASSAASTLGGGVVPSEIPWRGGSDPYVLPSGLQKRGPLDDIERSVVRKGPVPKRLESAQSSLATEELQRQRQRVVYRDDGYAAPVDLAPGKSGIDATKSGGAYARQGINARYSWGSACKTTGLPNNPAASTACACPGTLKRIAAAATRMPRGIEVQRKCNGSHCNSVLFVAEKVDRSTKVPGWTGALAAPIPDGAVQLSGTPQLPGDLRKSARAEEIAVVRASSPSEEYDCSGVPQLRRPMARRRSQAALVASTPPGVVSIWSQSAPQPRPQSQSKPHIRVARAENSSSPSSPSTDSCQFWDDGPTSFSSCVPNGKKKRHHSSSPSAAEQLAQEEDSESDAVCFADLSSWQLPLQADLLSMATNKFPAVFKKKNVTAQGLVDDSVPELRRVAAQTACIDYDNFPGVTIQSPSSGPPSSDSTGSIEDCRHSCYQLGGNIHELLEENARLRCRIRQLENESDSKIRADPDFSIKYGSQIQSLQVELKLAHATIKDLREQLSCLLVVAAPNYEEPQSSGRPSLVSSVAALSPTQSVPSNSHCRNGHLEEPAERRGSRDEPTPLADVAISQTTTGNS